MSDSTAVQSSPPLFADAGIWKDVDQRFDDLWPDASIIDGWLSVEQARALFRAATLVPTGQHIVEIGIHRGRSTVFLASAKSDGVALLAVDPFDDPRWGGGPESLEKFTSTLNRFGLCSGVEMFRGLSYEAAQAWDGSPVGLLFVDGAHDRASVLADIDGWEEHVASGGFVFFHDAFSSIGVTQVLTERHLWNRLFRYEGACRTLVCFRRSDSSLGSSLGSAVRLATRYPYFVRNGLIKLALRRSWRRLPEILRYRVGDDLF